MAIITYPEVPLLQKGLIDDGAGYYPNKIAFDVQGFGTGVNNSRVDACNIGAAGDCANYVFPAAGGIQMRVVSTSANDDGSPAGTGVRTVIIHYLDANYAVKQETITLNGTTAVNTSATDILRVNDLHSSTVGSIGWADGSITLENTAGTVVYARIDATYNRSRNAVFTIPAGKQGYIDHWNYFSGTTSGTHYTRFALRATCHENVEYSGVFILQDGAGTLNGGNNTYYDIPLHLPEKTDVKVSVISDAAAANAQVNSHFSGWYE
jgi:hypothetical protein